MLVNDAGDADMMLRRLRTQFGFNRTWRPALLAALLRGRPLSRGDGLKVTL